MSQDSAILIFDLEATGLDTARDQIIEIAIQIGLKKAIERKTWRVKPLRKISAEAQAVHGISAEDLKDCPPFHKIADEIAAFFARAEIIVAYNASYDITMLQAEFHRIDKPLDISNKLVLDPLRLWRRCEPRNLEAAVKRFAPETKFNAHAASDDVAATAAVLLGMKQHFNLEQDWSQLAIFSDPERLTWVGPSPHLRWKKEEIIIGFGKNQGKTLGELVKDDSSYLSWILSKDFPDHVKSVISEALKGEVSTLNSRLSERFGPPPSVE